MQVRGRHVVVTGGANGIGRALVDRFAADGASAVVVADLNGAQAEAVAAELSGAGFAALGVQCDVGEQPQVAELVRRAVASYGPVDVFVSNAGYSDPVPGDLGQPPEAWEHIVGVNLMAHVWAAREVVPSMVERGGGYLLQTISSAALITGPAAPGYTLTKHGALGFAEWLTLHYGHLGVRVSCLCPNAVYTGMFGRPFGDTTSTPPADSPVGEMLLPEDVAAVVVEAMADERFLILPHPRVGDSFLRKATDYDAWIRKTRSRLLRMQGIDAPA